MKVDGGLGNDLNKAGAQAKELEAAGYSGAWTAETSHDPFFPLLLAAEHTERLELGTSIAVAFARNPMILANIGWDLQAFSKGRFVLGLGSQIKPHIEKRFSMWGLIWLPSPSTKRPFEKDCRSQPMLASVIGLRANATAIDVPSSSRSVCSAASRRGRNGSWDVSADQMPS